MSKEHNPIETIVRGVWVRKHKVLLCQNRKHGYYFLPGGHIDPGETACGALAREVREELGFRLSVGRFIGAGESKFMQQSYKTGRMEPHQEINLVFELIAEANSCVEPSSITSQEAHISFEWVDITRVIDGSDIKVLPGSVGRYLKFHVEQQEHGTAPVWTTDWIE